MLRKIFSAPVSIVAAALLFLAAVAGVSYEVASAAGGGNPTFYGCTNAAGALRAASMRVGTAPTCKPGETLQSWNAQGPTGAQGPVGQASVVAFPRGTDCPQTPTPPADPASAPPSGAFLAIPSIPGESTDSNHANQIDVLSWSWGGSNGNGAGAACGAANGRSSFLDLTIVKKVDKSSTKLMLAEMAGTNLGTIVLSVDKQGTDYLVVTMDNARVSSVQYAGGGSQVVPEDRVTFQLTKVTHSYRAQKADGTFDVPIVTCFDALIQTSC